MYITVAKRSGDQHLVDFKSHNGTYHTWCEKILQGNWAITTLAADNIYPGICQSCQENVKQFMGRKDFRECRNSWQGYAECTLQFIRDGVIDSQDKFHDAIYTNGKRIKGYKNLLSSNRSVKRYE